MRRGKRKNKKNRGLFLVALAILVVGIGFAALQKYLTIDGTASINSNFDVRFNHIRTSDVVGGAYNKTEPSATDTTATFDAAFLAPGDSISYEILVENEGSMNAKLESLDVNVDNENISYEITGINTGDIIEAYPYVDESQGDHGYPDPTIKTVILKLTYNGDGSEASTSKVKVTMKFVQTNEQTTDQTNAIALIESEKPTVSYTLESLSAAIEYNERNANIYVEWNSEHHDELTTYFVGVEVYKQYYGGNWQIVKNATDFMLIASNYHSFKLRNVYAINGVRYYSQYSDEFAINYQVQDGFIYDVSDYNTILGTDDSYFVDGIMTLPEGRKFKTLTSKNVTKVIIPENYNLSDLSERSLPVKAYGTSLETIVKACNC